MQIIRELAGVAIAIQTEHDGRHAIQQIAIVSHQHQRAAKFEQALFEDLERGDVEIVCGLVQQQEIGGLQHQLCDEDASPLASGEVCDGLVELLAGE